MKLVRNSMAAAALAALVIAPVAAQAAPVARESAAVETADSLHGRGGGAITVIATFAVLLVLGDVLGAYHLFGHDHHHPTSP